ncbi:MAG: ShlB/FhaC/HecB family hemolysin secretion/activation protein [Rhodoferax sp.]|uniref:ShlB/FhaC/HecB family hemolysin secretion/activation protein n=1 Tax=Rhodoferax sp. TaxID=50421 RepID=UPI002ACDC3D6|nr:ShlB/FhaC/HecB family hemolysin secretion/activation protein [Rhodoferax sp.]MDZ7891222.1 ShlB/FhaC/HecB family hemolysin secretion/activation protein [Rhodoferax sp.]
MPHITFFPSLLLGSFMLAATTAPRAQQTPNAGTQLQQIPASPSLPTQQPDWGADAKQAQPSVEPNGPKVRVDALTWAGNQTFTTQELTQASGFTAGRYYTLSELRQMAAKVSSYYRERGYFLAQALVPAQEITNGVVQLQVLEGRLGQVELSNASSVSDRTASRLLAGLQDASPVTQANLERRILLLSDLPGVLARSTLRPGATPGTADVVVQLATGPKVGGSLELDNQGNHYTGTYRVGASLYVNEPMGWGDMASARLLTSGEGLSYGRVAYQSLVGPFTLGVATSSLYYQLGGAFARLESSGTANTGSAFASYPLLRSRQQNLSVQWSLDHKDFNDRTGAGSPSQASKTTQIHTLGLKGNHQDAMGQRALQYNAAWAMGNVSLQDATTRNNDAITSQSNGAFEKLVYGVSWQQELAQKRSLYLSLNGQSASKNLDASEKFSLGGTGGVRAYPAGEASGDEGFVLTMEGRVPWPALSQYLAGSAQAVAFIDTGTVTANKSPWDSGASTKRRTLSGAGFGLNFTSPNQWMATAYCAVKVGDEVATSAPDATWRVWLQAAKFF